MRRISGSSELSDAVNTRAFRNLSPTKGINKTAGNAQIDTAERHPNATAIADSAIGIRLAPTLPIMLYSEIAYARL